MMTHAWKIAGLILAVGGPVAFAQDGANTAAPAAETEAAQPARRGAGNMGAGMGMARQAPEEMLAEWDKPDGELDLDELVAMYEARAAARRGAGGAGPGMGAGGPGGAGPGMGAGGPGGAGAPAMDPEAMAERYRAQAQRQLDQFDADGNGKLNLEELTASQARGGNRRGAAPGGGGAAPAGFGGGGGGMGAMGAGGGAGGGMPPAMLEEFDTNDDGALDDDERAAMQEQMRARFGGGMGGPPAAQ